jgi:hypothetical protein
MNGGNTSAAAAAAAAAATYRRNIRVELAVEKMQRVHDNQQRQQRHAVIQQMLHRVHANGVSHSAKRVRVNFK